VAQTSSKVYLGISFRLTHISAEQFAELQSTPYIERKCPQESTQKQLKSA